MIALTPREQQIARLAMEGLRNGDIAVELGISRGVVTNRMKAIFDKTGMFTRLELAIYLLHHPQALECSRPAN